MNINEIVYDMKRGECDKIVQKMSYETLEILFMAIHRELNHRHTEGKTK